MILVLLFNETDNSKHKEINDVNLKDIVVL